MIEGGITFDGLRPEPVYPEEGTALDVPRVAGAVPERLPEPRHHRRRETRAKAAPRVTKDGVNQAVVWARKAVAAPVT